jgi:hypothetical protein
LALPVSVAVHGVKQRILAGLRHSEEHAVGAEGSTVKVAVATFDQVCGVGDRPLGEYIDGRVLAAETELVDGPRAVGTSAGGSTVKVAVHRLEERHVAACIEETIGWKGQELRVYAGWGHPVYGPRPVVKPIHPIIVAVASIYGIKWKRLGAGRKLVEWSDYALLIDFEQIPETVGNNDSHREERAVPDIRRQGRSHLLGCINKLRIRRQAHRKDSCWADSELNG